MITYQIKKATADVSVNIRIIDSADGTPETGVVYDTSGIDMWYRREGAVSVDITEATLAGLDSAHADGGFLHINDGYYRLDLPDAACAAGANGVLVAGTVTGMVVIGCYVQLVNYDPFDVVRMGMTALPNAAADAAGGLPISDAGGLDLDTFLGRITGNVALASVLGALADAAADGDPTNADTVMQYSKQLINVLMGTAGVVSFPAAAVPGDAVSLAEVIRKIHDLLPTALVGGRMDANVGAISADATAADTLELFAEALDQATGQIDNGTLATDLDTYQAHVEFIDDDTNTTDRYSVTFYKNGEPVLSGITTPKIQVIKDSDGTDLVAETALTEVGSLGHYRYTTASNRMADGASYKAKVTATIGAATRTWIKSFGRDS